MERPVIMINTKYMMVRKHLVAHLFNFLCCVCCCGCLLPVSCVPNVESFSILSILDCSSVFSNVYLHRSKSCQLLL